MRARLAHRYVHRAIAATSGLAEWNDPRRPSWDGARFHFARIRNDMHALHEIAHWIVAPARARAMPNYGLGTDPDGGPTTLPDVTPYARCEDEGEHATFLRTMIALYESDPESFMRVVTNVTSREEELASVVTVLLARHAGIAWAGEMRRVFGHLFEVDERKAWMHRLDAYDRALLREAGPEKFWGLVTELARRGIDLEDPLRPFELARALERKRHAANA